MYSWVKNTLKGYEVRNVYKNGGQKLLKWSAHGVFFESLWAKEHDVPQNIFTL